MTQEVDNDRSREKRAVFEALLAKGIAAVHLDPRRECVQVPPWLARRPVLVLNFSYHYRLEDFIFDDEHVFASLSFAGTPHPCRIPWQAVFAITDDGRGTGGAWPEDLPAEAGAVVSESPVMESVATPGPATEAPLASAGLRVISGGAETTQTAPRRDHLRRIK